MDCECVAEQITETPAIGSAAGAVHSGRLLGGGLQGVLQGQSPAVFCGADLQVSSQDWVHQRLVEQILDIPAISSSFDSGSWKSDVGLVAPFHDKVGETAVRRSSRFPPRTEFNSVWWSRSSRFLSRPSSTAFCGAEHLGGARGGLQGVSPDRVQPSRPSLFSPRTVLNGVSWSRMRGCRF